MKHAIKGSAETTINAPVARVWEALTDPDIIRQYFFGTNAHSDWKKGSPLRFTGEWQGKSYEDKGTILDIEKNRMLKFDYWSSMSGIEDKPENYVIVTYKLDEIPGGSTRLTVTQENIPTEEMREHSEQNWNMVLNNLKELLEKEHHPASH